MDQSLFNWTNARAFLAAAETGSFSGAARKLGLTQPTLGRQVAALEAELGVLLFERLGRRLALTEAGADMLDHVRRMEEAANQVTLIAAGRSQSIAGHVRISASDVMCASILPPLIRRLRQQAPKLRIDLIADNDISDLMRREADIAIRHIRPQQPDLIAKLVRDGRGWFYATPEYLERKGTPEKLADLAKHDLIHFGAPEEMIAYMAPLGLDLTGANFPVGSANGSVCWALAQQGLGVSVMTEEVGDATQGMVRLLPGSEPITFPIWLVAHRELHSSRKLRLVFDMLAEFLG